MECFIIQPFSLSESVRVGLEQVNLLSREIELSDQLIYWPRLKWSPNMLEIQTYFQNFVQKGSQTKMTSLS